MKQHSAKYNEIVAILEATRQRKAAAAAHEQAMRAAQVHHALPPAGALLTRPVQGVPLPDKVVRHQGRVQYVQARYRGRPS